MNHRILITASAVALLGLGACSPNNHAEFDQQQESERYYTAGYLYGTETSSFNNQAAYIESDERQDTGSLDWYY